MNIILSASFAPLLRIRLRYLFLVGGRGSGKSEFWVRKVFIRCWREGDHNFVILRKVRQTAKRSTWAAFKQFLDEQGIHYTENKTDLIIEFRSGLNGKMNTVQFGGLDDPKKIKSFKRCTGLVLEELTEFSREDFIGVDLILREETGHYQQIIGSFNPDEAEAPWIKEDYFFGDEPATGPGKDPDSYIHHSTIMDNPIKEVRRNYFRRLMKLKDPTHREIFLKGFWAKPKGKIFNWDTVPLPEHGFDQIWYGGDFGFRVDEAACVKIYRRSNEYWIELILYELGLTDPAMARALKQDPRFDPESPSYWDSAEPKAIKTLRDNKINARPAIKGKGSVVVQIDQMVEFDIHIVENELSHLLEDEIRRYKWMQDRHGELLRPLRPIETFDHGVSAARYGIYTNFDNYLREAYKKGKAHAGKKEVNKKTEDPTTAIITAAGRIVPPDVFKAEQEALERPTPTKGGPGYGTKKGRVRIR